MSDMIHYIFLLLPSTLEITVERNFMVKVTVSSTKTED